MAYSVLVENYVRSPQPALPESQLKYLQDELTKLERVNKSVSGAFKDLEPALDVLVITPSIPSITAIVGAITTDVGNVGIGVLPLEKLHISGPSFRHNDVTDVYGYKVNVETPKTVSSSLFAGGYFSWQVNNSGVDALTLDASGNLGIGYTTPSTFGKLAVDGAIVGSSFNIPAAGSGAFGLADSSSAILMNSGAVSPANSMRFLTANAERVRIDASGSMLVGTTSLFTSTYTGVNAVQISGNLQGDQGYVAVQTTQTASRDLLHFINPNGVVGKIQASGSATTYATASDYRLKENIQPMIGALDTIAQLKPCTYTWKADGSAGEGFIAHELQAVVSQCVTGEKDAVDAKGTAVYQGIDTSFLVATLAAAIQEQQALITAQSASLEQLRITVDELKSSSNSSNL